MVIKQGMRMVAGIKFLTVAMAAFESSNTNKVARPIPKPFKAEVVTPNVGHIPKSITKAGFSCTRPRVRF